MCSQHNFEGIEQNKKKIVCLNIINIIVGGWNILYKIFSELMRFTEENKRQSKCAVNTRSKYAVTQIMKMIKVWRGTGQEIFGNNCWQKYLSVWWGVGGWVGWMVSQCWDNYDSTMILAVRLQPIKIDYQDKNNIRNKSHHLNSKYMKSVFINYFNCFNYFEGLRDRAS